MSTLNQTVRPAEPSSFQRSREEPKARRYDVDWLRVLGIGTVFLFHCGRFFDKDDWHVKNPETSQFVGIVIGFVMQWMMPLFFVLSGISTQLALRHQAPGQFVVAKFKRLAIPLIVGSFILIAPLQVYLERVSHGKFSGSFMQFYPHYFDGWYGFGGNFAWMGLHLWYLEMLFIFSMLLLPLFAFLGKPAPQARLAVTAGFCSHPGVFLIPVLAVLAMEGVTRSDLVGHTVLGWRAFGGWPLPQHFLFFLLGYFAGALPPLRTTIERFRTAALATGLSIVIFAYWLILAKGHSGDGVFFALLRSLNVIAWLMAILGYGSRYFDSENRFLRYANQAVLPFYILHQTVLLGIGFFVVRWPLSMGAKFGIIALSSLALILATYDLLIKRFNPLRFLFGLKIRGAWDGSDRRKDSVEQPLD